LGSEYGVVIAGSPILRSLLLLSVVHIHSLGNDKRLSRHLPLIQDYFHSVLTFGIMELLLSASSVWVLPVCCCVYFKELYNQEVLAISHEDS
jgi:hypothetical protein